MAIPKFTTGMLLLGANRNKMLQAAHDLGNLLGNLLANLEVLAVVTLDDQNVIQDQMGDEVTDAVKAFQDGGNPVKELESNPVVLEGAGCD